MSNDFEELAKAIMTPTPKAVEQRALAEMLAEQASIKQRAYDHLASVARYDATALKHSGHKSVGDALVYTIQHYEKQLKKLIEDHVRRFPDK